MSRKKAKRKGHMSSKHVSRARKNESRLTWATATAIFMCVASALSVLTALLVFAHLFVAR